MKPLLIHTCIPILFCTILLFSCGPQPEDFDPNIPQWPCFLGPDHIGASKETDWNPEVLNGEVAIIWEAQLGGGFSSLAIRGDYLYSAGNKAMEDTIYCLDINDGHIIWQYSYPCRPGQYTGPRATPTIDEKVIYMISRDGRIFCLNAANGEEMWTKDLVIDFQASIPYYGFSSSPFIHNDLLIINSNKHGVVLDKTSGDLVWKSDQSLCGYASPVLYGSHEQEQVLFFGETAVYGVELESGTELWQWEWATDGGLNITNPLIVDDKVFITSSYEMGCALLDISNNEPELLWSNTNLGSHFSGCIYKDGFIYGNSASVHTHSGFYTCLDITSGQAQWTQDLGPGSLILVGDTFIFLSEQGSLYAVKPDPTAYQELARCQLPRGLYYTAPVFCRGHLYVKDNRGNLYCIDLSV